MARDDDFPNAGMTYTSELVGFIKEWEGCVLKCYQDAGDGRWTVGYGVTGPEVDALAETPDPTITQIEADALLLDELDKKQSEIIKLVHVPLTQQQNDAILSWHYNTGGLAKSTLLRCLNAAKFPDAAIQIARWVYAGGKKLRGLERRRIAEIAIFLDGDYSLRP